jgi:hypothetical protein
MRPDNHASMRRKPMPRVLLAVALALSTGPSSALATPNAQNAAIAATRRPFRVRLPRPLAAHRARAERRAALEETRTVINRADGLSRSGFHLEASNMYADVARRLESIGDTEGACEQLRSAARELFTSARLYQHPRELLGAEIYVERAVALQRGLGHVDEAHRIASWGAASMSDGAYRAYNSLDWPHISRLFSAAARMFRAAGNEGAAARSEAQAEHYARLH